MDYIDRIKKIKSEKKITNDRLSELTGIPLGTLSKILAGISDSPKLSNIVAIADALECSLDYLVSGVTRNTNNYTLTFEEIELIEDYRMLDPHSKELTKMVITKEKEREEISARGTVSALKKQGTAEFTKKSVRGRETKILPTPTAITHANGIGKRTLLLYNLPVSAGPGVYLDDSTADEILVPDGEKTRAADFALRISGNSMEPKYHDGDVVLVQDCDSVEVGEFGVFILDGNGYFKKYGGDCLISLNPEYGNILLKEYAEAVCCGRVVGKLKKK
ncbi:MAG: helix-turn-helix domain-containing protein [Clostridia bacterium]|nr:helix-turn-helix domain-containing protein [Clostridia bacterium]